MRVVLAKTAGFCMGVRRALNTVLEISNKKKDSNEQVFTYGPLIHNKQVVELLNSKGITIINNPEELDKLKNTSSTIIIRSHGVSPQISKKLFASNAEICDATCPRVVKVQSIIKKYYNDKYSIIIVGDKGHAEVEGLLGFAENNGYVVSNIEEAKKISHLDKVCVVGQTTQDEKLFNEITEIFKQKFSEIKIFDTICDSTSMRQKELEELTKDSDAIIVVGGKNSANTTRLADLSREHGIPTFHIEDADEIDAEEIKKYNNISITAGASTPNWIFLNVVAKISEVQREKEPFFKRLFFILGQYFLLANIYISLGAVSLAYTSCKIQHIRPRFLYLLLTFLYIFSMHVLNQFTEQATVEFNYPVKKNFYENHRKLLIVLGVFAGILALILAIDLGSLVFSLVLLATLAGIIYQVKIIPDSLAHSFKYQKLKDIPASKEFFIAIAWVFITVILPLLGSSKTFNIGTVVSIVIVFIIVFIRSIFFGIREVQGDRIVGKESIPTMVGEKKAKNIITILSIFLSASLVLFLLKGWLPYNGFYLFVIPLYLMLCLFYYKKILATKNLFELIIDASFILPSLIFLI